MKKSKVEEGKPPLTPPFVGFDRLSQRNRGEKKEEGPKLVAMKDGTLVPEGVPEMGKNYTAHTMDVKVEKEVWAFTQRFQAAPAKVFVYLNSLYIGPQPN